MAFVSAPKPCGVKSQLVSRVTRPVLPTIVGSSHVLPASTWAGAGITCVGSPPERGHCRGSGRSSVNGHGWGCFLEVL